MTSRGDEEALYGNGATRPKRDPTSSVVLDEAEVVEEYVELGADTQTFFTQMFGSFSIHECFSRDAARARRPPSAHGALHLGGDAGEWPAEQYDSDEKPDRTARLRSALRSTLRSPPGSSRASPRCCVVTTRAVLLTSPDVQHALRELLAHPGPLLALLPRQADGVGHAR